MAAILIYLIYQKFSSTSGTELSGIQNPNRPVLPKDYGQTLFSDQRFYDLSALTGTDLVQQAEIKTPSSSIPAPEKFQVFDMQSGSSLLFTWEKPEALQAATAVRITKLAGESAENLATLKPEVAKFAYTDAVNNQKVTYQAYYIQEKINSSSPQIPGSAGQVGGRVQITINSNNLVKLSWTNPSEALISKIELYRSNSAGSLGRLLQNLDPGTTEYEDLGSKPGIYFYTVVWAEEVIIGKSAQAVGVATDKSAPSAPSNLKVSYDADLGGVNLSWSPSSNSDVTRYEIYRSEIKNQLGKQIGIIEVPFESAEAPEQSLGYIDKGIGKDQLEYYSVVAVDAAGNKSTNQVTGVPGNSNPFGEP